MKEGSGLFGNEVCKHSSLYFSFINTLRRYIYQLKGTISKYDENAYVRIIVYVKHDHFGFKSNAKKQYPQNYSIRKNSELKMIVLLFRKYLWILKILMFVKLSKFIDGTQVIKNFGIYTYKFQILLGFLFCFCLKVLK